MVSVFCGSSRSGGIMVRQDEGTLGRIQWMGVAVGIWIVAGHMANVFIV